MKSLAIIQNPRLTTGQKSLYTIVCQKIQSGDKLIFQEAKDIYLKSVNRYMIKGIPHRYNYWIPIPNNPGSYTSELQPMTEEEINFTVLDWLTSNLGRLILKGYLTVLPAVDLNLLR